MPSNARLTRSTPNIADLAPKSHSLQLSDVNEQAICIQRLQGSSIEGISCCRSGGSLSEFASSLNYSPFAVYRKIVINS